MKTKMTAKMTKKEFFNRKNRNKIYNIYETIIWQAHSWSNEYDKHIKTLRALKDKYRTTEHIWELLDRVENDCGSNYELEAFCRCQQLTDDSAFKVDTVQYEIIQTDIMKFTTAIGKIKQVIDFIDYVEDKELTVRAK